jgi:hypothetical protein
MSHFEASAVCWLFGALQVLGLTSAWAARLSERSRRQASCQRLFFGCLALIGGATIISLILGPVCWLTCGITLSLMVLTATCDFSGSRQATLG